MKQRPVPLYIKNTQYDGYSEGWGLYVESLYKTKDPYILYYQSMYNIVRSVRLVVDIGIHMYGWSLSKTLSFMKYHTHMKDEQLLLEIYRYIDTPGQALSYKMGELTIRKLKKQWLSKGGTEAMFHKHILDRGPCPISFL